MGIELSAIKDGDEVKLQDHDGNIITAAAHVVLPLGDSLYVYAFGTRITFARHTRAGWQRASSITVLGHQPSLFA